MIEKKVTGSLEKLTDRYKYNRVFTFSIAIVPHVVEGVVVTIGSQSSQYSSQGIGRTIRVSLSPARVLGPHPEVWKFYGEILTHFFIFNYELQNSKLRIYINTL